MPLIKLDHEPNFLKRKLQALDLHNLITIRDAETVRWKKFDLTCFAPFSKHMFHKAMVGNLIPTVIDQNPCAHLRMPRDMIFHGWSMRLFQAWQHSATMSS